MLIAILLTLTSASADTPGALDLGTVVREYEPTGVERIQIENVSGKINVRQMERHRFIANVTKKKFSENCKLTIEKTTPDVILVRIDGPSFDECESDFDLQVPKEVDLTINAGAGAVDVSGVEGRLSYRVGTGNVNANGNFKSVEGRSGTGSVNITGIEGQGKIETGSGSVSLKFNSDPKGDFVVDAGTGDATVLVPKGLRIRAELASATGTVTNEISTSAKADFGLNLKSGTGAITVKSY